jgi:hypothetical protein
VDATHPKFRLCAIEILPNANVTELSLMSAEFGVNALATRLLSLPQGARKAMELHDV